MKLRSAFVLCVALCAVALNGCSKKKGGDSPSVIAAPAPAPSAPPAGTDIGRDGAVIVFPRPLVGPISIDLSRK